MPSTRPKPSMLKLTIELEATFITRRDQLPFATALALTRTAQAAQERVRNELPSHFTIRNSWVSKGILIERAEKKTLEATIFSRDDFMILQEKGGTKLPRGRSLSVPIEAGNKRGIVRTDQRPKALESKPDVFRATIGGLDGLWQRRRGAQSKRRRGERSLKLLFAFKPSVPVKARFGFLDSVREVFRLAFPDQFRQAFARAIATAR
jgi:hypothetical protein